MGWSGADLSGLCVDHDSRHAACDRSRADPTFGSVLGSDRRRHSERFCSIRAPDRDPLLPTWLSGDKLFRVILGFSLFIACYQAEILRGGLQAIEHGQVEAAKALGLRYWQYQLTVILPQVFRITLPQTVNQVVTGFKDTSYVAIVGFFDLVASASAALGTGDWAIAFVEVYIVVGLLYFVFGYSLAAYGTYIERKMSIAHRR
jgi:general L-amino acid transport system permease protein